LRSSSGGGAPADASLQSVSQPHQLRQQRQQQQQR